jgi:hypothetical protein
MSKGWLDEITGQMTAKISPRPFAPSLVFGFEDVRKVLSTNEAVIESKAGGRQSDQRGSTDPLAQLRGRAGAAPMAVAFWETEITFPIRRDPLIAVCSHIEHVLCRWCEWLHGEWFLPRSVQDFLKSFKNESSLHRYVRYLRDEAGLGVAAHTSRRVEAVDGAAHHPSHAGRLRRRRRRRRRSSSGSR